MENLKRKSKKILIILTILAIVMNMFPIIFTYASQEGFGEIILRKGYSNDDDKVLSLELCVKNMGFIAADLTFKYPKDCLQVIDYSSYKNNNQIKEATRITQAIEDNLDETGIALDSASEVNKTKGEIHTILSATSAGGSNEAYDSKGKETVIGTIYLKITDENIEIDDLYKEMFELNKNEYFCVCNEEEEECTDVNLFKVEGFGDNPLPTVSTLTISTLPTNGTEYVHGEEIDLTGGELTATYTDTSTETVSMKNTNVTVTTGEKDGAFADVNNPKITFEYGNKTVDLDVTVNDPVDSIEIYDPSNRLNESFDEGENIKREDVYIKTTTKSGVKTDIPLSNSKISLDSTKADTSKIIEPFEDTDNGGILRGIQKIEATYEDDDVTLTIPFYIVVNDTIGSIEIAPSPAVKQEYNVNDTFEKNGAIIVKGSTGINYGTVAMSADNVEVTEEDGTQVDLTNATSRNLKVSFLGQSRTYSITMTNKVESIRVDLPDGEECITLEYNKTLTKSDLTGITITEVMADGNDGAEINLSDITLDINNYDNTKAGDQEVIINYYSASAGKTLSTTVPVRVEDKLLGIEIIGLKTEYKYKEDIDYTGAELYVNYLYGIVGPYSMDEDMLTNNFNNTTMDTQNVTFTYDDGEETATKVIEFNVIEADPICEVEASTATYGQTLADVAITGKDGNTAGTFAWKEPTTSVGTVGPHEYTAIFTPTAINNYNTKEVQVSVTVGRATLKDNDIVYKDPENLGYTGTAKTATVEYKDGITGAGTISKKYYDESDNDITETGAINVGTYKVKVTVAQGNNYNAITEEKEVGTFTITKGTLTKDNFDITGMPEEIDGARAHEFDNTAVTISATVKSTVTGAGSVTAIKYYKDGSATGTEEAPKSFGSYVVKAVVSDGQNYNAGEIELGSFDITKTQLKLENMKFTEPTNLTYTGTAKTATVEYKDGISGAGTIGQPKYYKVTKNENNEDVETQVTEAKDAGTYKVKVDIDVGTDYAAKTNWEVGSFTIAKADPTPTLPTNLEGFEGQTLANVTLSEGFSWVDTTTPLGTPTDEREFDAKYEPTDKNNYNIIDVKIKVKVKADYVTQINVSNSKPDQKYGKEIDLSGVTLQKTWASGVSHGTADTETVTLSMISSSALDVNNKITSVGTGQEVTVTYINEKGTELTGTFTIDVEDVITSITMSNINTEYWVNENIDSSLAITIHYAQEQDKTITMGGTGWNNSWISGIDMSTPGSQTLTIKYGDDETLWPTKDITVKDWVKEIKASNYKLVYKLNDTVDFSNIVVNYTTAGESTGTLDSSKYTVAPTTVDTSSVTSKEITVTHKNEKNADVTDNFTVQVINAIDGASLNTNLSGLPTEIGDTLNTDNVLINVIKQDGTTEPVKMSDSRITYSPAYNPNTLNKQEISMTYTYKELNADGEEKTLTIPVSGKLIIQLKDKWTGKIKVDSMPTTSILGKDIDLSKAKVSKLMVSGNLSETTSVLGAMISNFDKNKLGEQTITITNWGASVTSKVTVTDKTLSISMNKLPVKTEYKKGETIDLTGAKINVVKQSGTKEIAITKEMISGFNSNKAGQQTVTVIYDGYKTQFVVNVKAETTDKPTTKPSTAPTTKPSTKPTTKPSTTPSTKPTTTPITNPSETPTIVPSTTPSQKPATVTIPGDIKLEVGEELDLSNIKMKIFDEEGNVIKEIPVTKEMISGFNPNKEGTQTVKITYQDEKGDKYTDSFTVVVKKPVKTLGVKDEDNKNNDLVKVVLPSVAGVAITGSLLLLIAAITKKNVEIYAVMDGERKLLGKQKISRRRKIVNLDEYKDEIQDVEKIELVVDDKTVDKFEGEEISTIINNKAQGCTIKKIIKISK